MIDSVGELDQVRRQCRLFRRLFWISTAVASLLFLVGGAAAFFFGYAEPDYLAFVLAQEQREYLKGMSPAVSGEERENFITALNRMKESLQHPDSGERRTGKNTYMYPLFYLGDLWEDRRITRGEIDVLLRSISLAEAAEAVRRSDR